MDWRTGPGQRNGSCYQDRAQRRYDERRHPQRIYDRHMRRLDRELDRRQQALNAGLQKKEPDRNKVYALRLGLSELEQRYDPRRAEFECRWGHENRQ